MWYLNVIFELRFSIGRKNPFHFLLFRISQVCTVHTISTAETSHLHADSLLSAWLLSLFWNLLSVFGKQQEHQGLCYLGSCGEEKPITTKKYKPHFQTITPLHVLWWKLNSLSRGDPANEMHCFHSSYWPRLLLK